MASPCESTTAAPIVVTLTQRNSKRRRDRQGALRVCVGEFSNAMCSMSVDVWHNGIKMRHVRVERRQSSRQDMIWHTAVSNALSTPLDKSTAVLLDQTVILDWQPVHPRKSWQQCCAFMCGNEALLLQIA